MKPSPLRRLALALALALGGAGLAPAEGADVVRLRSGETIKGRIVQERTSEDVLVVEDYLAGAQRELGWDALDPADRERIRVKLGYQEVGDVTITCDVLALRQEAGNTVTLKCVVLKEEGGALIVRTLSEPKGLRIPKERIASRAQGECDPRELYSWQDLADLKREELAPSDAKTWFTFAQYCEAVGAYPPAKEGYENAASDETYPKRKLAQDGVARVESILRDQEAVDEIVQLKMGLTANQFKRVREALEAFPSKHPSIGDPTKKKLEDLKTLFTKRRTEFFRARAVERFEKIVRDDLLRKRCAVKDVEYAEINGWIRKEAPTEGFRVLLTEMQRYDPAVTEEEIKGFWENRDKKGWRTAKYGSGTRFFYPPKILPKTGTKAAPQQKRDQGGGPAPVIKLPEPPQRDEWWKNLPLEERVGFWWAHFVEKSGLFEVDPKQGKSNCQKCEGDGTKTYLLSNGQQAVVLCERCAGARYDILVKYR